MSDLCVCMNYMISEFHSEIDGSHASCALMLFLCSILCLICSECSLNMECILHFEMLCLSAWIIICLKCVYLLVVECQRKSLSITNCIHFAFL